MTTAFAPSNHLVGVARKKLPVLGPTKEKVATLLVEDTFYDADNPEWPSLSVEPGAE
jgi:hypothetical protein